MDFRFSPEEEAFRAEVGRFLAQEAPPGWEQRFEGVPEGLWAFEREFQRRLAARRWLALAWPKDLGGGGATHMEQLIFKEAMAYHRAPGFTNMGVAWVGPSIMSYGTAEQKAKYVRRIADGQDIWCTLYSEPGAGSDLAAMQTRADLDGDEYVINGQKIWTTYAHLSDYGWLGVRTNPRAAKHRGISTLIVEMKTPGVSIRPLVNMADGHEFNEVFFDNVRVSKENLVGEENRGWYQIATGLDIERTAIGSPAAARRLLEDLVEYWRESGSRHATPGRAGTIRLTLADLAVAIEVNRILSYRIASMQTRGLAPNYEASMAKMYGTELNQRLMNTGLNMLGLAGQLDWSSTRWAPLHGRLKYGHLRAVANTIEGGTSEIQRSVIATRGLGLPRA
jgi:alkylation response protein AidB-like acyl-CoA dehydrogenase